MLMLHLSQAIFKYLFTHAESLAEVTHGGDMLEQGMGGQSAAEGAVVLVGDQAPHPVKTYDPLWTSRPVPLGVAHA
jgi:hypothetical protein